MRLRPRFGRWTRLRLALAVLTLLAGVQVLAANLLMLQRMQDAEKGHYFPLPDQAAALVDLVEAAPPDRIPQVLRATNSAEMRVQLLDPQTGPTAEELAPRRLFPNVERVVQSYLDALGEREVAVYLSVEAQSSNPMLELRGVGLFSDHPLRLDIRLRDGRLLRIETRGDLVQRVFGWPIGLGAGVIGVLIAALAIWTIWRNAKPILGLADRLDRFADAVNPAPMTARGPEEVRRLIAAFNRMQPRISELLQARNIMLGALSHDLRTYLTRLRLRVEFIESEDQRDRAEKDLAAIDEILGSALQLARSDALGARREAVDLGALLRGVAADSGLEVETAAGSGPMIEGDAEALRRALGNLVQNARKYAPCAVAPVELSLRAEDTRVALCVCDRGPGIPAAERARLRKPFERGNAARTQDVPGSGLGLAIVQAIARAHGGSLELSDRAGGGLCAEIRLPRAPA